MVHLHLDLDCKGMFGLSAFMLDIKHSSNNAEFFKADMSYSGPTPTTWVGYKPFI